MIKMPPITKIEFSGSYNRTFHDVSFYFTVDPLNYSASEWKGDIKITNQE